MDGILIIDKPAGITSHDVVMRVRRVLGTKRVGHTGTLDPLATGVLVLLIGNATRLAKFIDKDEKEYEASVKFGSETDTGDVTGKQKAEGGRPNEEISRQLSTTNWGTVFAKFRGDTLQTPPMYSAKKVAGKKLYELARAGIEVERKAVPVTIRELELIEQTDSEIRIRVSCSAGTYIRTLAEEIGREVGPGAHLVELRRTRAGKFGLQDGAALAEFESSELPLQALRPITEAVGHLPELNLTAERAAKTRNGLSTRVDEAKFAPGSAVRMLDENSDLIAIGIYDGDQKIVKPKIVLV